MTYFTNYTTRKRTRDCDRLLFLHVLLCFFSFLVILAACAGSFVHWSSFKRRVQDGLWNVMQDYAVDRTSKMTMDTIQIEFQCCGSENFREWFYVPWAECTGTKEEYDEDETETSSSKKVNVVEEQDEDAEEEEEEEDDEEEDEEDDEEEEEGEEADQYKHQVDLHSTIKHSSSKVERTRERRVPSEMDRRKMLKMCREVNVEYKMSPHMLKRRAACDHPEDGFDDKHKTLKVKSSDVYGRFRGTLQDTMDRRESHRYEMAVKAPEYKKIKKSPHKVPVIPPHPPSLPPPPPYPYMYHSDWSKTEMFVK